MPRPLRRLLPAFASLAGLLGMQTTHAATDPSRIVAVGAGVQRMPSWPGSRSQQNQALPYLDFEWPDHVSLSTEAGLHLDLIGGSMLHGGVYGDYQWGRESEDLGVLRERVAPLSPRLTLGGYLEWQLTRQIDVGTDLSHDINGAGTYFRLYADWDLPALGPLQHAIQLRWQAMNRSAMQRFFGISQEQAAALGVQSWEPGAGSQRTDVEYDAFMPTSAHTGLAASLAWGRLLGAAASSPLVARFGSRNQVTESLAFLYHF